MGSTGGPALFSFLGYLVLVGLLAWWSARGRTGTSFVSEYFLGGRNLGVWALALTFAATAASGGTFVGFPALIYTHGWVLALWICGYMMVPLVAMGLLGKRLNQVAQRSQALTVPEVIRERFGSAAAGAVATLLITFFMFCYLLAQFKAGSKILSTLLSEVPLFQKAVGLTDLIISNTPLLAGAEADYLLCLTFFAMAVIAYVVYGGFRAVVWTDVMQGIIMGLGVLIMLVLVLQQTGGLEAANRKLGEMTPPEPVTLVLERSADILDERLVPKGEWVTNAEGEVIRLAEIVRFASGETVSLPVEGLRLTTAWEIEKMATSSIDSSVSATVTEREPYLYGADQKGVYLTAPGPSRKSSAGFLSLTMAFSFFVFWAFSTAAQPSNMVRLMAFRETATLRHAMVTVSLYFTFIYFTLVVIFCCGRTLLPGMEIDPDRTMPQLAATLTSGAGVPWLAGLLLAAPFAAVMSSVDSFLLVASSSLVRDLYQRFINPDASDRKLKRMSYATTTLVGVAAFLASIHPAERLQDIIVFASGGVAACFLVPMIAALYWKRVTALGVIAGMLGGCLTHFALYLNDSQPLGLGTFIWDQFGSALALVSVSLLTVRPEADLVKKYFG